MNKIKARCLENDKTIAKHNKTHPPIKSKPHKLEPQMPNDKFEKFANIITHKHKKKIIAATVANDPHWLSHPQIFSRVAFFLICMAVMLRAENPTSKTKKTRVSEVVSAGFVYRPITFHGQALFDSLSSRWLSIGRSVDPFTKQVCIGYEVSDSVYFATIFNSGWNGRIDIRDSIMPDGSSWKGIRCGDGNLGFARSFHQILEVNAAKRAQKSRKSDADMNLIDQILSGGGGSLGTKIGGVSGRAGSSSTGPKNVELGGEPKEYRDPKKIIKVIQQSLPDFMNRFQIVSKSNPELEGIISLKFNIAPSGNISSISVMASSGSLELDQMVMEKAQQMKFDSIRGGNTTITYTFHLDSSETFKKQLKSAIDGDANAQNNVGNAFYSGKGVKSDKDSAFKWYTLAASQGHSTAQYSVCVILLNQGTSVDRKRGIEYCEQAASQGDKSAIALLKKLHLPKDDFKELDSYGSQGGARKIVDPYYNSGGSYTYEPNPPCTNPYGCSQPRQPVCETITSDGGSDPNRFGNHSSADGWYVKYSSGNSITYCRN